MPVLFFRLLTLSLLVGLHSFVLHDVAAQESSETQKSSKEDKEKEKGEDQESIELFNGKDLTGWSASTDHWTVQDGVILVASDDGNPVKGYTNLEWTEGKVEDFELKLDFRFTGDRLANGGVLFRCSESAGFYSGYEADLDQRGVYVGSLSDAMSSRGTLATRGQEVTYDAEGERKYETFASLNDLKPLFKKDEWNELLVRAEGNKIQLDVNGERFAQVQDNDESNFDAKGSLTLQLSGGKTAKLEFRNIRLTRLEK